MCNFPHSFRDLEGRFGIQFDEYFHAEAQQLESLRGDGFFHRSENGRAVLPIGQVFIRDLAMVLDAYLKKFRTHCTLLNDRVSIRFGSRWIARSLISGGGELRKAISTRLYTLKNRS